MLWGKKNEASGRGIADYGLLRRICDMVLGSNFQPGFSTIRHTLFMVSPRFYFNPDRSKNLLCTDQTAHPAT